MNFSVPWFQSCAEQDNDSEQTQPNSGLILAAVVFVVVASFLCRDEFLHSDSLPLKSTSVATVPLFNAWTIGWNADRLLNGMDGYWDAPIFSPTSNAFAFSEPQPATMLVAPVVWLTGSTIVGYKAWMFVSLALNGFFTALLLRRMRYPLFHQLMAGIGIMLLPVLHQRIDVLQLVPVWGVLWFWSSLFQLIKVPGLRTASETGVAFAMCFGLCVHHALFVSLLLPFAGIVFLPTLAKRKMLLAAIGAILIASPLTLPIILPIKKAADTHDFVRDADLVKRLSAFPEHYLVSQKNSLTHTDYFTGPKWRQFCVGWVRMGLAIIGLVYGLTLGKRRRWILFISLTAAFAFAFSLGLNLNLFGWRPWQWLSDTLPGFGQVRSVYRFVWFAQMALILLAAEGLLGLHALCRKKFTNLPARTALTCLVVVPGAVLAFEVLPEPSTRGGVPFVDDHTAWTDFVRNNVRLDGSIACLPFATGVGVEDYDVTTRWMLYSLCHKTPMVNGYSGFFPSDYISLRDTINEGFPSTKVMDRFVSLDVDLIVVANSYRSPEEMRQAASDSFAIELVFEDPIGIDVYRLSPVP